MSRSQACWAQKELERVLFEIGRLEQRHFGSANEPQSFRTLLRSPGITRANRVPGLAEKTGPRGRAVC